ncbi:Maf family protein [Janibacter sp. G349]|uniref:Maf family protein n=1 Tax=Janibacter sp. G349 TaxID=3405424 RepID=UPI003B7D271D
MVSLVLASASPARLGLLRASGMAPDVVVSDVDEHAVESLARQRDPQLSPVQLAQLLAEAKGAAVASRLAGQTPFVLACDSVLEVDGQVHGKPGTPEVARERWQQVRGRSAVLHTGHHLVDMRDGRTAGAPASATVHFASVSDAEIDGYVATGEPLHVAGGFTLDGLGAPFVESIEGHPSTVVGLCLPLLRRLLTDLGTDWWLVAQSRA